MQVNKIQNTTPHSFCGKVTNSEDLEKILRNSKKSELRNFNKLLKKIGEKDDNFEFSVKIENECDDDYTMNIKSVHLVTITPDSYSTTVIDQCKESPLFHDPIGKPLNKTLTKIIKGIKKEYSDAKKEQPKENLLNSIFSKLK